jgi:hypothetical protein
VRIKTPPELLLTTFALAYQSTPTFYLCTDHSSPAFSDVHFQQLEYKPEGAS